MSTQESNYPAVNVYAPRMPGNPAYIIADRPGLKAVIAACERALDGERAFSQVEGSDQQPYELHAIYIEEPARMLLAQRPYTHPQYQDRRAESTLPGMI